MVKVVLILAAFVGSVLCEPPIGLGINGLQNYALSLNLGNLGGGGYAGGYGAGGYAAGGYVQPVVLAGHTPYTVTSPAYSLPPSGLNFALGFDKTFSIGHGAHGGGYQSAPIVKHAAPVVVKQPLLVKQPALHLSHHNYDHAPFKPLVKRPVYKAPSHYHGHGHGHGGYGHHGHSSEFTITPSISYGYSYKLIPTHNYGPVVSGGYKGGPTVHVSHHHDHHDYAVPSHGHGKSVGFGLNLNLGHHH